MLYSPSKQKKLGQIIANWDKVGLDETLKLYRELFYQTFSKRPGLKSHINVLQHIYGHFSDFLKSSEKRHIHNLFNKALDGKVDIKTVIEYIKGFVFRFDDEYLKSQTYLFPYPEELD
ncbi:MAG: YbgA family protein [Hydrogenothermaceae bacterium]